MECCRVNNRQHVCFLPCGFVSFAKFEAHHRLKNVRVPTESVANLEKALEAKGGGGESLVLPRWPLWATLLVIFAQYNCINFSSNVVRQHSIRFLFRALEISGLTQEFCNETLKEVTLSPGHGTLGCCERS